MRQSAVTQTTSRLNGSFLDRWQAGTDPKRKLVVCESGRSHRPARLFAQFRWNDGMGSIANLERDVVFKDV